MTRAFDAAFGRPRGIAGRLGGVVMARGNAEQERQAMRRADPQPGAHVLVVGHGPGVGLAVAAEAVAPGGHVTGVDPSATMRDMAASRCTGLVDAGVVEIRDGSAEHTGCADADVDAVTSVNNVMLWDRAAGFAELRRVLRPGGRLVVTVHRHVLDVSPERLLRDAQDAGFAAVRLRVHARRFNSPAVELLAEQPG